MRRMTVAIQSNTTIFRGRVIAFTLSLLLVLTAGNAAETDATVGPEQLNAGQVQRKGVQVEFKATAWMTSE